MARDIMHSSPTTGTEPTGMIMVCLCDEDASCEHGTMKLRSLMNDGARCLLFVRSAAGEHVPLKTRDALEQRILQLEAELEAVRDAAEDAVLDRISDESRNLAGE